MGFLPLIITLVWKVIQMTMCMVPAHGQAEPKGRKDARHSDGQWGSGDHEAD